MTPDAAARGGRARRRPGRARGQRRRDAGDAPGGREHRRRLHLGRRAHPQRPGPRPLPHPGAAAMNLPMLGATDAPLMLENIPALQDEVRALAAERGAVILAHNYQLPEIQDVADYVGDSLGLSQQAAAADAEHDRLLRRALHGRDGLDPVPGQARADPRPRRRLLAGRLDHRRRSCASGRPTHPGAIVVMYVNTTAEVKAETDYCCTSANAVAGRRAHLPRARRRHRDPVRPRHVPRRLRREDARPRDARVGRRVPRPRRDQARTTSPPCAPRTRAPTS